MLRESEQASRIKGERFDLVRPAISRRQLFRVAVTLFRSAGQQRSAVRHFHEGGRKTSLNECAHRFSSVHGIHSASSFVFEVTTSDGGHHPSELPKLVWLQLWVTIVLY